MTMIYRFASELPCAYVDPIAERRENPLGNSDSANAYNDRMPGFNPEPQSGENQTILRADGEK